MNKYSVRYDSRSGQITEYRSILHAAVVSLTMYYIYSLLVYYNTDKINISPKISLCSRHGITENRRTVHITATTHFVFIIMAVTDNQVCF